MGLDFTGDNGDVVAVTDDASFQNQTALTVFTLVKFDSLGQNRRVWHKATSGSRKDLENSFTDATKLESEIPRATTNAKILTTDTFSTGTWYWLWLTYDETNGSQLYYATPTAAPVEASYDTQTVGSGATTDDSGNDLDIGGRQPLARSIDGQIARFQWFNERLVLADILGLWYDPLHKPANMKIWLELGLKGTGTQPDYSGNGNTGTVTGATQAPHVPIPILDQVRLSRASVPLIEVAAPVATLARSQAIIIA